MHDLVENSFTKYELCKVRDGKVKSDGMHFSESVNSGDGNQYHFRSKPVFLDLDIRDKHILETGYPEDETFHICLIGWTRMTRDDIDPIGDSIMKDFGKYTLFWNNCQRFLRELNGRIRNQRAPEAADYSWFKKNMRTSYQRRKKLMKQPPDASSRIAKGKIEELRFVSQQVEGGNVSLSTQQLIAIQDGITQNAMINMQTQPTFLTTMNPGVAM